MSILVTDTVTYKMVCTCGEVNQPYSTGGPLATSGLRGTNVRPADWFIHLLNPNTQFSTLITIRSFDQTQTYVVSTEALESQNEAK